MQGPTEEHPNYQLQAMLFTLTAQQQGWCLGPRALITDGISFSKPPYEVGCAWGRKGCRHSQFYNCFTGCAISVLSESTSHQPLTARRGVR